MSDCRKQNLKKVVTLFRADTTAGRQQMRGLFRYLKEKSRRWQLVLRIQGEGHVADGAIRASDADGFIFSETEADRWMPLLSGSDIPVVSLDAPRLHLQERRSDVVFLNVNNRMIGEMAAAHFLGKGKPRTAVFVHDSENRYWSLQREEAFRDAMSASGIPCATAPSGDEEVLAEWLGAQPKPVAVMAAYDVKAAQVLEACRLAHLDVPAQVNLIGVDNDPFYCDYTEPTLSSIELNFEYEGYRAAEELDRLLRSRSPRMPKHIQLPPVKVVERESSANIVPAATMVRNALTYIKDNAADGISVGDVVRSMHVSRRLADLRFRQLHGKTINACIVTTKLEAAERLLRTSSLPLVKISELTGFSDAKYMMRLFRKAYGTSMMAYRRQKTAASSRKKAR